MDFLSLDEDAKDMVLRNKRTILSYDPRLREFKGGDELAFACALYYMTVHPTLRGVEINDYDSCIILSPTLGSGAPPYMLRPAVPKPDKELFLAWIDYCKTHPKR